MVYTHVLNKPGLGICSPLNDDSSGPARRVYPRARLLRTTISFAILSVLMAAILVIALFFTTLLHVESVLLCAILFIGCLVSLIISLLAFLQDINLSLLALKLELAPKDGHAVEPVDGANGHPRNKNLRQHDY